MGVSVELALVCFRLYEEGEGKGKLVPSQQRCKASCPSVLALMMSAFRDLGAAFESLNLGADYLLRNTDLRELKKLLREFGDQAAMAEEKSEP